MNAQAARTSVEAQARQAYGRLVALVASRTGDLAGAEDALGDALLAALERWPLDGTPANPQAWLLTVARRRGIDRARRRARAEAAQAELGRMHEEAEAAFNAGRPFPDERLGLMLACAHPAIDPAARTPLMLQAVLGLSAERIGPAFLSSPAAMTKRLVRAKARLAATGIRFETPDPEVLPERLEPVLDAVYAAFTLSRDGGDVELEREALWLSRLIADLARDEPEAIGLLALTLFVSAREPPALGDAYIPLSRQDPANWNLALLDEAEALLRRAGSFAYPGRFQLEAAIQAVHAGRRRSGRTDWPAILMLYERLLLFAPTVGARVSHAAALAQSGQPGAATATLDAIEQARVVAHQPYWATRAHAFAGEGRRAEAADAYRRAAGLCEHASVRAWLLEQRARLNEEHGLSQSGRVARQPS